MVRTVLLALAVMLPLTACATSPGGDGGAPVAAQPTDDDSSLGAAGRTLLDFYGAVRPFVFY